jgi:Holliday junction resolvase-like predicted endonuclease
MNLRFLYKNLLVKELCCNFAVEIKNSMQTMEQEPRYPVGVQNFEKIRQLGTVYVDKTRLIYDLTHRYEMVFLSRPRRFGKSLLVDTMARYFNGQKELFEGLAMEQLETEWIKYPVLRFSFGDVKGFDMYELRRTIEQQLKRYEKIYGADPLDTTPATRFSSLIERAYEQTGKQVVILIDEYDAPLLEVLTMPEKLDEVRNYMRNFYSKIKTNYEYIRFAFLTGISTFSQLGMFSELNNLVNITNVGDYSAICGITLQELKDNFGYGIRKFAECEGCTFDEVIDKLRDRYDGYHFTKSMVDIFNPFSLLSAFSNCEMNDYWFQTGTPTLAINMLKAHKGEWHLDIDDIDALPPVNLSEFSTPLEQATKPLPFLYQSGYLTIKSYPGRGDKYILGVPNAEVRIGLLKNLIPLYTAMDSDKVYNVATDISLAFDAGDYDTALNLVQSFLAGIPVMQGEEASLQDIRARETYYHKQLYIIFRMLHDDAWAEVQQAVGKPDIVVRTRKYIYIIEVKLDSTPQVALEQIEAKQYAVPYLTDGREIVKLGINFSSETRTIGAWERGE